MRSIIDGENLQQIAKAAKSLEQDEDTVKGAVRALTQMLTMLASASVYAVSEKVFAETLSPMKLSAEALSAIFVFYSGVHGQLRDVLRQFKIETSRHHTFDWRLDVEIGSRALHRRVDPVYLCELQTASTKRKDGEDEKEKAVESESGSASVLSVEHTLFECDFANLENICRNKNVSTRAKIAVCYS